MDVYTSERDLDSYNSIISKCVCVCVCDAPSKVYRGITSKGNKEVESCTFCR